MQLYHVPRGAGTCRRIPLWGTPWGTKIVYNRLGVPTRAKVHPRSLRKAKKCPLGGPRVPKVGKKEPKRRPNGCKMVPKIILFQKSAECEFDPLFTIYKPHRDLPKRHFFLPWRGLKEAAHHVVPPMSPRCCKMTIKGLKNAQSGALWKAKGSPRGSERLQKVSKKSSKIDLGCRDAP